MIGLLFLSFYEFLAIVFAAALFGAETQRNVVIFAQLHLSIVGIFTDAAYFLASFRIDIGSHIFL